MQFDHLSQWLLLEQHVLRKRDVDWMCHGRQCMRCGVSLGGIVFRHELCLSCEHTNRLRQPVGRPDVRQQQLRRLRLPMRLN